jgi:HEAT repeat protein
MGNIGGAEAIPALARAAAASREPAERDTAQEALSRLRGPGVQEGLINHLTTLDTPEKTEVLRAIGERGETGAAKTLLQYSAAGPEPVRLAALESLRKIAVPNTLLPLLDLAAKSSPDTDVQPTLRALYAVCQATPDKDQATRQVLEAMKDFNAGQRSRVLSVLAELGTPTALDAITPALRGSEAGTVREALRVVAQWPNATAAPILLELARTSTNAAIRILALRGCLEVSGQEPDHAKRLAMLREARSAAQRPDEKKLALGKVGQIPTPAALQVATADLSDPELATEAGLAALGIAEQLAATNPALASETGAQVLAKCKNPDMVKRAWALRGKPVGAAPFIQDWQVAGPYRQPGVTGALAVFDIAFGPEKPGEQVAWKPVPRADQVNLMALFPDEANCAAYLRTQVIAQEDCEGLLLLGSDDGVKAWLNGTVVHSNNIDRGDLPDQDMAPIHLRKGTNDLMLKITQGGGGWSARARIVGADDQSIPALRSNAPPKE